MKKLIIPIGLLLVAAVYSQIVNSSTSGYRNDSSTTVLPPHSVYASRPGSPVANQVFIMDDTDCSGTASATPTQCKWSGSVWQATGGTGSGGSSTTNPLQTLANLLVRTSGTVLTVLPNAAAGTPYGFVIGTTYNFTTPATATISAGTGDAYEYVDSGGVLSVGHNGLTVSCSGCTAVASITDFPEGSVHIGKWHATSGTWDTSGGTNYIGVASTTRITGSGVTWNGTNYVITGGGGGGPTCAGGTVPYTSLTAAATTQEITIASSTAALTAFGAAYFSQDTNFSGGSATALYVSMGRTGSNNFEMSGGQVALLSGGITTPYSFTPPSPLQTTGTYNIVLAFTSVGANLNTFTAGSLSYSVCSYAF